MPGEEVAIGATTQAKILKQKYNNPLSLGLSLYNGNFSIIIPKNTSLPCSITKRYETAYDNQTEVSFNFFKGEKYMVEDNNYLYDFKIHNITKAPKGEVKFDVTMKLEIDGILKINVNEINGSHSKSILIKGVNDIPKKLINKLEKKNIIRNEDLKFLPQIELYFNKQINITKDNILQFKKEIKHLIQEIDFSIIEIKKGSLKVLLTLQYIILREFINNPSLSLSTLSNKFDDNIKKEVQRVVEKLRNFPFISLGTTKPTDVNENIIDLNNENNREEISRKILQMSQININDDINILEISKNLEQFYNILVSNAEEQELNQLRLIEELDEFNKVFDIYIEKYLKESIFEYKITHIFLVEKELQNYKNAKNSCRNTETKVLLHGTNVDSITNILKTQFYNARIHIFGIGVYFTDMIDYSWYYASENRDKRRDNFNRIPQVGESFSVIASEIYYDKNKLQKVYNTNTRDKNVELYGIRCAYVDYSSRIMSHDELIGYNGFIGNEFCITEKNQILPLYGVTFRRIKYLVIWRDYNFNLENPNQYNNNVFQEMQEFHQEIKKIVSRELDSKIYYMKNTEEALTLLKRKKYNNIILITNGNNDGRDFILNARRIIKSKTIAAVSVYNVSKHISWVKNMPNTLLLNGLDFHKKFFKGVMNNDLNLLNQLKNEIINYYSNIPNFYLNEFDRDLFNFPNFKSEGRFQDLIFDD